MPREQSIDGVSFRDVAAYLEDLTRRRGGYWCFSISYDLDRDKVLRLTVMLEGRDHVVLDKCVNHPKRHWAHWPDRDSRTFAGLMHRMCYELDERLDERERLVQATMPF